jgi:triosephosphate isomerase
VGRKPIIAGNWKMNRGTSVEAGALAGEVVAAVASLSGVDVVVCPPLTALASVHLATVESSVAVGAQDCFWKESGAYTSQIAPSMLAAEGVSYVILGHSETRGRFGVAEPDFTDAVLAHFGESDQTVNRKTRAALAAGLVPIVCIGETLSERESGDTDRVVSEQVAGALLGLTAEQVAGLVLAYEPVWAIGTGRTCDADEADRVCGVVRATVASAFGDSAADSVRIQYGGSMKPDNAAELLAKPNIDGGLIGGASLKAADFSAIVAAAV